MNNDYYNKAPIQAQGYCSMRRFLEAWLPNMWYIEDKLGVYIVDVKKRYDLPISLDKLCSKKRLVWVYV